MKHYRVVFKGEVDDKYKIDAVKNSLASLFRKNIETIDQLFSGKPIIIKKNLTYDAALEYKQAFEKTGALCAIDKMLSSSKLNSSASRDEESIEKQSKAIIQKEAEIIPDKEEKTSSIKQLKEIEKICGEQVRIKQNTRSLELDFPPSRNSTMGRILFVVALIFLAATGFVGYGGFFSSCQIWFGGQYSAGLFNNIIESGCILIGVLFISLIFFAVAIDMLTNRIQVWIGPNGIKVNRQSLLFHSRNTVGLSQIRSISAEVASEGTEPTTLFYTILAELDNHHKLTLGDGIQGQQVADSLTKFINKRLSLLKKSQHTKISTVSSVSNERVQQSDVASNTESETVGLFVKFIEQGGKFIKCTHYIGKLLIYAPFIYFLIRFL